MIKSKPIAEWAEDDRPREKLLSKGRTSLSLAELLAIILGSGSREESAVDLAKRILAHYNNSLQMLGRVSVQELCKKFKGVGTAKAVSIIAVMELASRKTNEIPKIIKITCSKDAYKLFAGQLTDLPYEELWVAILNNNNKVLSTQRLSKGGTKGTVADKSILFKKVIEYLGTGIILCHNHPAGSLQPSREDIKLTQSLKDACELLDIKLLDHLILAGQHYFSFADEGYL